MKGCGCCVWVTIRIVQQEKARTTEQEVASSAVVLYYVYTTYYLLYYFGIRYSSTLYCTAAAPGKKTPGQYPDTIVLMFYVINVVGTTGNNLKSINLIIIIIN